MDSETKRRDALAGMLDAIELAPAELETLAARARDVSYWSSLAPDLAIGGAAESFDAADAEAVQRAAGHLRRQHYFKADPIFDAAALRRFNAAIDALRDAGWPPVFALVYDVFWSCLRHPLIAGVVGAHLGGGYRQIPHVWVHLVPALAGARGWMPHFDGFRPRRMTIWIALTDATVDNGCMFIIPPDSMPEPLRTRDFDTMVAMRDVMRAVHATRALEVEQGAVLGWDFDVFHWGGRAEAPRSERRSISLEFIAAGERVEADEAPLVDVTGPLPPFATRLAVIASALTNYAAREASLRRYRALAPRLLSSV
jgi:hypothetical protein